MYKIKTKKSKTKKELYNTSLGYLKNVTLVSNNQRAAFILSELHCPDNAFCRIGSIVKNRFDFMCVCVVNQTK